MKLFILNWINYLRMDKKSRESFKKCQQVLRAAETLIGSGLVEDKTMCKANPYNIIVSALEGLALASTLKAQGMSLEEISNYINKLNSQSEKPLTENKDGKLANVVSFPKKNETNH